MQKIRGKTRRILNLGCGKETYGTDFLDINPTRKDVGKWSASDKIPFGNSTFDEVYMKNFFEHLNNPNKVLKEIRRVLKRNGKIVLITDNASFFGWHLGNTHYGGYEKQNNINDMHYALYTSWHIQNHLKQTGFRNISVSYILGNTKNLLHFLVFTCIGFLNKKFGYNLIKAVAKK